MGKFDNCKVHMVGDDNVSAFYQKLNKALSEPDRDIVDVKYTAVITPKGNLADRALILYKVKEKENG